MKKRFFAYALLIVFGLIFLLQLGITRSPFRKNNTSFSVKPGTEITGIDLIQGEQKVILRKDGDKWKLNKTYEARNSAVEFIILTLKEMRVKSTVSSEKFGQEIVDRKIEPVRVNVYQKRRLIRSFYVYKTGSNIYGNIMKMRPSANPYIVYMPGYEDNIGSHFLVSELFWQPFTVFRLLPSQIESVELRNFVEPEASFTVRNARNGFFVYDSTGIAAGCDTARVKRYFSYFVSVAFEAWAFDLNEEQKREIVTSEPLYRVIVKKADGGTITLTVREKWKNENGKKVIDTDRVWGETDDGRGLFVMRYFDLDPVLKKKSYFFGG